MAFAAEAEARARAGGERRVGAEEVVPAVCVGLGFDERQLFPIIGAVGFEVAVAREVLEDAAVSGLHR